MLLSQCLHMFACVPKENLRYLNLLTLQGILNRWLQLRYVQSVLIRVLQIWVDHLCQVSQAER